MHLKFSVDSGIIRLKENEWTRDIRPIHLGHDPNDEKHGKTGRATCPELMVEDM